MKFIKIILFSIFVFVFISNLLAQEIQKKKEIVDSLFELVKKITPANQNEVTTIKDPDLEKAKQLLYEAYAYAPIEFENELHKWTEEWRNTAIKGVKPPNGIKPGTRLQNVKEKLAEKYGWEYVRFLETPYFMKFRILTVSNSSYNLNRPLPNGRNRKTTKIDLEVEILEVLKGKNFYSTGDTITISYLPIQFSYTALPEFEINQIYAAPLKHWSKPQKPIYHNLMLKLNGLHTLYKIENNIVYSPLVPEKNFSKPWREFKSKFNKRYLNMEDN